MSFALKLALGPLLLAQGLYVRSRTPVLPEPQGERVGISGNGPPLRLLVVGDSAAAGVGVDNQSNALLGQLVHRLEAEHEVRWRLMAKTGATTQSTLAHLIRAEPLQVDVVVTSLGVNDVTSGVSTEGFIHQQQSLLHLLQKKMHARLIIVSGLPPMHRFPALPQPLRWYLGRQAKVFDRELQQLISKTEGCIYLKQPEDGDIGMMASDGFHPGADVYSRWAGLVATSIR